jgi:1,5-anhydro-D-fructose reductase (1,5-anhydro-D-mannitol-forming)
MTETQKHRIAVVGVWHVHAKDYVGELLGRTDVTIVGVWDRDGAAASAFADERGLATIPTLDEVLASDIDAAIVDTATAEHTEIISALLNAGKHVFTEKVLALTVEDVESLEALADTRGVVLHVSLQRLSEPWVQTMVPLVRSGLLGEVTSSRMRYQHGGAVEGWLPDGFFDEAEAGGGAVVDFGAHGFYLTQLLHGSYPIALSCTVTAVMGRAVEDNAVVTVEFAGGALSVLETSLVASPYARWAEVYGTSGYAVVDSRDDVIYVRLNGSDDWVPQTMAPPGASPLEEFLLRIAGDQTAPALALANRHDALRLTALFSAAYRSVAAGAPVQVSDPVLS